MLSSQLALPADPVPFLPTVMTILLMAMLIVREVLNGLETPTTRRIVQMLNVSILPLLATFIVLVILRVLDFMG